MGWVRCKLIATVLLVGSLSSVGTYAMTYRVLSPEQVTEYTDVWVHGRILKWYELAGAWPALANRGDEAFLSYLREVVDGKEKPQTKLPEGKGDDLRRAAASILISLLPREERLMELVRQMQVSGGTFHSQLMTEVKSEDRFLSDDLVELSLEQWRGRNGRSRRWRNVGSSISPAETCTTQ